MADIYASLVRSTNTTTHVHDSRLDLGRMTRPHSSTTRSLTPVHHQEAFLVPRVDHVPHVRSDFINRISSSMVTPCVSSGSPNPTTCTLFPGSPSSIHRFTIDRSPRITSHHVPTRQPQMRKEADSKETHVHRSGDSVYRSDPRERIPSHVLESVRSSPNTDPALRNYIDELNSRSQKHKTTSATGIQPHVTTPTHQGIRVPRVCPSGSFPAADRRSCVSTSSSMHTHHPSSPSLSSSSFRSDTTASTRSTMFPSGAPFLGGVIFAPR